MRKIILSILGILFIIGSFMYSKRLIANKKRPKPVIEKLIKTVFTDTIQNSTVDIIIAANGKLTAKRRIELFSEVQGIFKKGTHIFKPGQKFRKGQTLISIDASEYYASVQSSKSNLYNAIIAIMPDLRLDFPDAFPKWENYIRSFDLSKTTPVLPEIKSEKEKYFISGRQIISNYYSVKNLEQRLTKYKITAPFSGIVTEALVTEGSLIRNSQKLGEFIDSSIYEMEVAISSSQAPLLKIGKQVNLSNIEKTETYIGIVSRINGNVNNTTQTVSAFIEIKDPSLKEGMFLEASLNAKKEFNAVEVDRNLLLENDQIYIIKDSVLAIIAVKPVYFSNNKVVLKSIPDNTIILKKPVPGAYPGMIVKPYREIKNK